MHELYERLKYELHNSWRFRWQGFAVLCFVALVGWAYTFAAPNQYESRAKVHVDTAYVLRPLLRGMVVEPNLSEAVQLLTKTVLSRQNLEQIANNANLNLGDLTPAEKDRLYEELQSEIVITGMGNDLYEIQYKNNDPVTAKKVVEQVLNIMMADALGTTQEDSVSAQKFLKEQLTDYGNQLNQAEKALAKFERDNYGYLPSDVAAYSSEKQAALKKREKLRNELVLAKSELQSIRSQLHDMRIGISTVSSVEQNPNLIAMNEQILKDQQALSSMLTRYTSIYPGVVSLKDRIQLEKNQKNALLAKLKNNKQTAFDTSSQPYQSLLLKANDTSQLIRKIQTQLKLVNDLISNQRNKTDRILAVQVKLEALTRNYKTTEKQYNKLLQRFYAAKLSQGAQMNGNPLKFQIIDPPILPRIPVSPKRHIMAFVVLVTAIMAGILITYLLSQLKPIFQTKTELSEYFSLPVIGVIPFVETFKNGHSGTSQIHRSVFPMACVLFLIVAGFAVVFSNDAALLLRQHLLGLIL